LRIKLGAQTSWTLTVVGGAADYLWTQGTNEVSVVITDRLELAPAEQLKLVTVGASGAMAAVVMYELSRKVD
jgi:hypothetical protein